MRATARAIGAIGAEDFHLPASGNWLELTGPTDFVSPTATIECQNSGTSARLLLGLIAGLGLQADFDGDPSLRRRPMDRVVEPLRQAGAEIDEQREPGRLPLSVRGGVSREIEHRSEVASAQVKSALLFAGLTAGLPATVIEPAPSRDHTERMLNAVGVEVTTEVEGPGQRVCLRPPPGPLRPLELTVPGDISAAAFLLAFAAAGGCDGLVVEDVGLNPGRTGFLSVLRHMGAALDREVTHQEGGEPVGRVSVRPASLTGVEVPRESIPALVDEIPVLACLAVRARGTTLIRGARELRVKESDRITSLVTNLSSLGVGVQQYDDGLAVEGTGSTLRGHVTTQGDHRIAMAFGMLGALPGNEIEIDDRNCAEVSYPGFWKDLAEVAKG